MARLLSVNVGVPKDIVVNGAVVRTAIWKEPVKGRVMARRMNLDGDGQADLIGHGGEQRAVLVYQSASYLYWERFLGRAPMPMGQFGENLTVEGMPDNEVCIGDRYRIGRAVFEVSQPRVTCHRLALRLDQRDMPSLVVRHGRPGFYMRVIEEGDVGAGDEIEKLASGLHSMSVAAIDILLYGSRHPADELRKALDIPALSMGWRSSFQALLEAQDKGSLSNAGLTSNNLAAPAWSGFRPLRVIATKKESADVRTIELASPDASPLPAPAPGQYLVLRIATGRNASPIIRCYSLSGNPDAGTYRISAKRELNGLGSAYLHDQLSAGDMLEVSSPRGSFTLSANVATPLVLISAGIGATPVLAMLYSVLKGPQGKTPIWWIHGARDGLHHSFASETRALLDAEPAVRRCIVYSRPRSDDEIGRDFDEVGHVDLKLLEKLNVLKNANFYLCGPVGFLASLREELRDWGVADQLIHIETFGTALQSGPTTSPHPPSDQPDSGPSITFVNSNLTVRWDDRYGSLLELAEQCSVPVSWSCRSGVCHRCETAVIGGNIQYAPEPIDPPSRDAVLICCARPLGDVQLDL